MFKEIISKCFKNSAVFGKDIRVVFADRDEVIDILQKFVRNRKLDIVSETDNGDVCVIRVEGVLGGSFFGLNRQLVQFELRKEENESSRISIDFHFSRFFRQWFFAFLILVALYCGYLKSLSLDWPHHILMLTLSAMFACWVNVRNSIFINQFYDEIIKFSRRNTIISKAFNIPDFPIFIISFFVFIAYFLLFYASGIIHFSNIVGDFIYALLSILFLMVSVIFLSTIGSKGFSKVNYIVPHLTVAVFLLVYSVPSFLTTLFWHTALIEKPTGGLILGLLFLLALFFLISWAIEQTVVLMEELSCDSRFKRDSFIADFMSNRGFFEWVFVIFWGIGTYVVIKMAIFAFYCLNFLLNGDGTFFLGIFHYSSEPTFHSWSLRIMLGLYGLIFVLIIRPFFVKRFKRLKEIYSIRKNTHVPKHINEMIGNLCSFLGVEKPIVLMHDDGSRTPFSAEHVLGVGVVLWIQKGLTDRLTPEFLNAVLAHEMFHIKKHNVLFSFLSELSEWTFFGKGFLVFALNTREMEFEADAFSVRYLEANGFSRQDLVDALDVIRSETGRFKRDGIGIAENTLHNNARGLQAKNFFEKLKIFEDFYYGDDILPYIYPSLDKRKERIKQL